MNLQESVRKVLMEELNIPLYIKRRLYIADEYVSNLNFQDVCKHWADSEINDYVRGGMGEITRNIIDMSGNISDDDYSEKYDEIYEVLIDLGYREILENFFIESLDKCKPKDRERFAKPNIQENIIKVLMEENNYFRMILRRVPQNDLEMEFEESLDMSSNMLFNLNENGGGIMSLKRFIDVTISILIDGIHYELYSTIPDEIQWYDEVQETLKDHYKDRIKVRYKKLISEI